MVRTIEQGGVEAYHFIEDASVGLSGVIALHSTALGPAAGGCRLWNYSSPAHAQEDAGRLAEGMSYKNALAGLPLGGGKAVLCRPDGPFDRAAYFQAFGRAVERLGGAYVTAEDVGTHVKDMEEVRTETRHVAGLPATPGRAGGDPSPWTAHGVFVAMRHAAERRLGKKIADCTVAIQGVGNVGGALAMMLHAAGARLVVADVDAVAAARIAAATGADVAPVSRVLQAPVDIFAPCALGAVLNEASIPRLIARVVCGAANNQLADAEDGRRLAERDILYAPDYVVNAGGIINVAAEYLGWSVTTVRERIGAIDVRLAAVLDSAESDGIASNLAADAMARETIASGAVGRSTGLAA